jgi:hypothetical protein
VSIWPTNSSASPSAPRRPIVSPTRRFRPPEAGQIGGQPDQLLSLAGAQLEGLFLEEAIIVLFELMLVPECQFPPPFELASD